MKIRRFVRDIKKFEVCICVVEKIDKTSKAVGMSRSELLELMISKGFHFPEDTATTIDQISKLQAKIKEEIKKKGE